MISESKSTRKEVFTDADWICDGIAVNRVMLIKSTWNELTDTFLEAAILQEYLHPAAIQIIMDTYDDNRIKETIQASRGISILRIFISNGELLLRKIRMIGIIFLIMVRAKSI